MLDRRTLERIVAALGSAIPAGDATHRGAGVVVPDALQGAELSTQALLRTRDALSRKHLATARIRPEALARAMRRVVWPERLARRLVEEAPAAYRDLGEVLEDQEDLVQRERRLEPIAVLKG